MKPVLFARTVLPVCTVSVLGCFGVLNGTAAGAEDSSQSVSAEEAESESQDDNERRQSEVMEDLGVEDDDITAGEEPEPEAIEEGEAPPAVELEFYGSARLRMETSGGQIRFHDNNSRVGLAGAKFVTDSFELFTRVEFGVDIGGTLDQHDNPRDGTPNGDDENIFPRIGFIGLGTQYGALSYGKQWSVYYDVAAFTDRFAVFGASASGTYNAGTDGGGSGTGRADNAGKYRLRRDAITLGAQIQNQAEIPLTGGIDYDLGYGLSLTHEWPFGLEVGGAYNRATIDNLDANLRALGLTGDSEAAIVGLKYNKGRLYIGTTYARHRNLEATDQDLFVDGTGWELYGRFNVRERFRVVGGANVMEPDSDDPNAGRYDIRSGILGMQYTYGNIGNGDIVYFETQVNNGHNFDGSGRSNVYTVGFRYSVRY